MPKNVQMTIQLHSLHMLARLCSKSFKLGFSSIWTKNSHVQAGFWRGRRTKDQVANIRWIVEKAREFQKISTSASLTILKPLTVWITRNCGKFCTRWEYQTTLPVSRETCMQDKKKQLEPEELTGKGVQTWERSVTRLYTVTLLT